MALTPRTLEGPILPAQRMDVGLTRFGVEEVMKMRNNSRKPLIEGLGGDEDAHSR